MTQTKNATKTCSIINKTKSRLPRLPFCKIKNAVLSSTFTLSLVFVDSNTSKQLNKTYRNKNKPTNVLSFLLNKKEGEILIDTTQANKEALSLGRKYTNHIGHLFIHGLFHLKGYAHGSIMEKEERAMQKKFSITTS